MIKDFKQRNLVPPDPPNDPEFLRRLQAGSMKGKYSFIE